MNSKQSKRIVVKVGSSLVTNNGEGLDHAAIAMWAEQIASLLSAGHQVLMVSSGAIAEGMQRLGWTTRPTEIHQLQAAAAALGLQLPAAAQLQQQQCQQWQQC